MNCPFSCGSQFKDWKIKNCDICQYGYDNIKNRWRCNIEKRLDRRLLWNGKWFTKKLLKDIGADEEGLEWTWRCPNFKEVNKDG